MTVFQVILAVIPYLLAVFSVVGALLLTMGLPLAMENPKKVKGFFRRFVYFFKSLTTESETNARKREMVEDSIHYAVESKTIPSATEKGGIAYRCDDFTLQVTPKKDKTLKRWLCEITLKVEGRETIKATNLGFPRTGKDCTETEIYGIDEDAILTVFEESEAYEFRNGRHFEQNLLKALDQDRSTKMTEKKFYSSLKKKLEA
jgi:hypothetical protein